MPAKPTSAAFVVKMNPFFGRFWWLLATIAIMGLISLGLAVMTLIEVWGDAGGSLLGGASSRTYFQFHAVGSSRGFCPSLSSRRIPRTGG